MSFSSAVGNFVLCISEKSLIMFGIICIMNMLNIVYAERSLSVGVKRIPLWICFNIVVIVIKLCFTFEGIMFVIITPFWFGLRRIGINMHSKKNEIVNDNF
jgi:hypothetical protein